MRCSLAVIVSGIHVCMKHLHFRYNYACYHRLKHTYECANLSGILHTYIYRVITMAIIGNLYLYLHSCWV